MTFTCTAPAAPPHSTTPAAVAVVAPCASVHDLVRDLGRQGTACLAITPPRRSRPLAAAGHEIPAGHYAHTVWHESLRRTLDVLRAHGVRMIAAGSAEGIDLADQLARQLALPGADPATSPLRRDRAAQAGALSLAGLAAPHHLRTASLSTAVRWAKFVGRPSYVLAPSDTTVAGPARVCRTQTQIALAWPTLRRAAHRQAAERHLVLQEHVPGPSYLLHTVSRAGHHTVATLWSETRTPAGLPDRTDLLSGSGLLARALMLYLTRALDVLGVVDGAFRSRIAYTPDRGPLLLSARLDPTATLQAATGLPLAPPPCSSQLAATRVSLIAPQDGTVDRGLLRAVTALPTVNRIEGNGLYPGAPVARTVHRLTSPGAVLLTGGRRAIEADYRALRSLEAQGLFAGRTR